MNPTIHYRSLLLALCLMGCAAVAGAQVDNAAPPKLLYQAHNLVSDGALPADHIDKNLVNPWGVAFNPNAVVWVGDNGTGVSTLYDGAGVAQSLVVTIPPAKINDGLGHPTGVVFNGSSDFVVKQGGKSGASVFLFAGEDGSVSGWSPDVNLMRAVRMVDRSAEGAVYKGIALGADGTANFIYLTDFHNGHVDVFNAHFAKVNRPGAFEDGAIPAHFAPFGIQNVNGDIVVTYAKQDSARHDNLNGAGLGFVDIYDTHGKLIRRFATRGALNAPWGVAMAPLSFGQFGGALLIGNFGDGRINAFEPVSGKFLGPLMTPGGQAIHYNGLWGIAFGNGVAGQSKDKLYFAAGTNDEADGVYGVIRAVPGP